VSGSHPGFSLFFLGFLLLVGAGVLILVAMLSFFTSLTPLYVSIGLCVAAIACAMVGFARYVRHADT
jgi:hypothetical protein